MRTMLNLLPRTYRRQQLIRKRAIQWCSLITVVLISAWTWHWFERREDRALIQQLEVLEREQAPTHIMLKQLVEMRSKLEELQQQETVARELEYQRSALALLGVISKAAQTTEGRLRVTKFELTGFQDIRQAEAPGSQEQANAGLLLSGVSLDNSAVAELFESLQDSGIFRRVELLATKERQGAEVSFRDYQVRCEF
jgi:Fimbrial assembly protein (PilN)